MQPPAKSSATPRPASPLILVGASVRAAAESARRAGYRVHGIDLFGDRDTRAACSGYRSVSDLLSAREPQLPEGDVVLVGGLRLENEILQKLGRRRIVAAPASLRQRLCEPDSLRSWAESAGLHFPNWRASSDSGRSLIKDPCESGGLGVRWKSTSPEARPAGCFEQPWIAGRCYGASFLSDGETVRLLAVCRSLFTRHDRWPFIYRGSYGPAPITRTRVQSLERLGEQLRAAGLRGLFNTDLILDRAGRLWLLEVNPRWSGSSELVELALRKNNSLAPHESLIGFHHRAWRGELGRRLDNIRVIADVPAAPYLKWIVFARRRVEFELAKVQRQFDALAPSRLVPKLHDIPYDGTVIQPGEPVATLFVQVQGSASRWWPELRRYTKAVRGETSNRNDDVREREE